MEAQLNYPKTLYRSSLQSMSYSKMAEGAFQKNYDIIKAYIAKYLPLAQAYKKSPTSYEPNHN
jgi:hypothetical protein